MVVRRRDEHNVSRRDIDPDAQKVLYRLQQSGYVAYLVGGSVRDLLLGRKPKDFDISTDAHPNQIKKLFRNCFLIGRRFRLAHIRFGTKVIETSTFRRQPENEAADDSDDASLLQHRDNTFGTPEEDARRRDFTVNGLFYDIGTFEVIDHVGGLKDVENRVVRCIGDPDIRFREDPVRMVRAVRFAARLGFSIDPRTLKAIRRHSAEIEKAAKPRMLEEIYRLFGYQSAKAAFKLLHETDLLKVMFPELDAFLRRDKADAELFWRCLAALDACSVARDVAPALMMGVLFYVPFRREIEKASQHGGRVAHMDVARGIVLPFAERYQLPKKIFYCLLHVYAGQRFLDEPRARFSKKRFVMQEHFPETIALFEIYRTATGQDTRSLGFWHELYREHAATHGRPQEDGAVKRPRSQRRRRGPRRPRRPNTPPPQQA